jgi:hypothetical protein
MASGCPEPLAFFPEGGAFFLQGVARLSVLIRRIGVSRAGSAPEGNALTGSGGILLLLQFLAARAPRESEITMPSTKHKLRLAGAFAALAMLALAVSCKGFFVTPTITSITIGPTGETLVPGGTLQMVASGVPSDGSPNQIVTNKCFWSSSNPAAATVGQNTGLVTAATTVPNPPQTTTITAVYQALTPATASLSVCPAVIGLTITASPLTVPAGTATVIMFTATATFSGTGSTDVTNEVTWNISNTAIITSIAGGSGTTTGSNTTGTTTITATLCNFTSTNSETITAQ